MGWGRGNIQFKLFIDSPNMLAYNHVKQYTTVLQNILFASSRLKPNTINNWMGWGVILVIYGPVFDGHQPNFCTKGAIYRTCLSGIPSSLSTET